MFCDIIFNVYQSIQWALFKLYGDFLKRIGYLQKQYFQQTPKLFWLHVIGFILVYYYALSKNMLFIFLIFLFVEIHVYVVL